jgi:hypothetical protein
LPTRRYRRNLNNAILRMFFYSSRNLVNTEAIV